MCTGVKSLLGRGEPVSSSVNEIFGAEPGISCRSSARGIVGELLVKSSADVSIVSRVGGGIGGCSIVGPGVTVAVGGGVV